MVDLYVILMDKESVYTQIQSLKASKKEVFKDNCAIELIRTTGYSNIMDMLLLPLYYAWEHSDYGTLDQVGFEKYLTNAYHLYCLSTKDYTSQIVLILKKASLQKRLSYNTKHIVVSLLCTYSNVLQIGEK